jgi:cytoskeletal protein CcmA (bactofilin family)
VEGSIDLKGNHLIIGQQGVVKANLMAKTITIEGTVEGDLIGQERIEIKASSNVKGNLIAARVTLEDGAKFRGSIDMDSQNGGNKYTYSTTTSTTSDKTD